MDKEFTFIGDLSTALDYARWRLDDTDPQVTNDSDGDPSPFLWDATYTALFARHGPQMGMYLAAKTIAAKLAKEISSFGEAAGVRFSFRDRDYYESLAQEILSEPPYGSTSLSLGRIGKMTRGQDDSLDEYRKFEVYPEPTE